MKRRLRLRPCQDLETEENLPTTWVEVVEVSDDGRVRVEAVPTPWHADGPVGRPGPMWVWGPVSPSGVGYREPRMRWVGAAALDAATLCDDDGRLGQIEHPALHQLQVL